MPPTLPWSIVVGRGDDIMERDLSQAVRDDLTNIILEAPDNWSIQIGRLTLRFTNMRRVALEGDQSGPWNTTAVQPIDLGMTSSSIVAEDFRPPVIDCGQSPMLVINALRRLVNEPHLKGLVIRFPTARFDLWRSQGKIRYTLTPPNVA